MLADATVEDGTIKIRDEAFEVLILPPLTHIRPTTFEKLKQFVAQGGSVIADTLLPLHFIEPGSSAPVSPNGEAVDFASFFGHDPRDIRARFDAEEAGDFEVHAGTGPGGKGTVIVFTGPGMGGQAPEREDERALAAEDMSAGGKTISQKAKDGLRQALLRCLTPDVTLSDEHVFYLHRVKDGQHVYFFANTKQEDRGRVEVTLEQVGRPQLWNPNTGTTEPIHVYDIRDSRLVFHLDFPASEAYVVVVDGEPDEQRVTDTNLDAVAFEGDAVVGYAEGGEAPFAVVDGQRRTAPGRDAFEPITLPDTYAFRTEEPNVLLIGDWKMRMLDSEHAGDGFEAPGFDDSDWLDVTNGAWEMQLPQERDEATYPVTVQYRTTFQIKALPEDPRLLVDGFRGESYRLFLNGQAVTDPGARSYLDAEIKEIDIEPFLQEGTNTIALELVVNARTEGLLDLLKIVGTFALEGDAESGWAIAAPREEIKVGDWTAQGYPFFSGTGVYTCEVDVREAYLTDGRMMLEAELGEDVLDVRVNGGEAHVAPWHPYRLDLTEDLRPGRNSIELRVTNTLINVLEGVTLQSGLREAPVLTHAHRYALKR